MRAAALLLLASLAVAQTDRSPAFDQARAHYYRGSDGDKKAYADADRQFSALYRENPREPRIQAYYGSLRLLEAASTWALWKKNALSRQGIELLDAAVAAAPADLEVRFVRAATTYRLPAFFHRKEQSAQDFSILAQRAKEAARNGRLEPRLAAASLYYHAEFLKEAGKEPEARRTWQQAIDLAPESRAARESRAALQNNGS